MASTYSTSLRIELQGSGENSGTWGTITNNNFSQSLEFAIAGIVDVACGDSAVTTLTNADGPQSQANNQARNAHIRLTGSHTDVRIAQFPATQKIYLISNATSGGFAMTVRLGASGNTLSIANGATRLVATDGTNWYDVFASGGQYGGSFLADGTVDVNGENLVLDADGDTMIINSTDDRIEFSIAGTGVGNFTNDSSNFVITSGVQDADIIFKGDDGGAAITALTLDMSDAGKATFNGVVDADAGITVDNITIDGTEIDLSSGDLTLDVAGDIILDADGGDVKISDAGTHVGSLTNSASDFVVQSIVSDKDIIFKGNDGGATITALTLDMSGAGAATFNNDVTAFSDERLKTDIKTIEDALEKVSQMRGVTFKREGVNGTGVIAQEVQPHLPEVVHDKQEYLSVAYGNMVGILIEAIKELKTKVDKLGG
jgi:hypothetical protein